MRSFSTSSGQADWCRHERKSSSRRIAFDQMMAAAARLIKALAQPEFPQAVRPKLGGLESERHFLFAPFTTW
jgi:hypothetical protein